MVGRCRLLLLCTLVVVGCAPDPIEVNREQDQAASSFGMAELNQASDELAKKPKSAAAYDAFRRRVKELRPAMAEHVAEEADRRLTFAALEPMIELYGQPFDAQFEALALTVWPVVLGETPKKGEDAWAFASRICQGPLALKCKYIVKEHWPVLLASMVWQRFTDRARELYSVCERCKVEKSYEVSIERFRQYNNEVGSRAGRLRPRAHPKQWPFAGDSSSPWPQELDVLAFYGDGTVELGGEEVGGSWRTVLGERRGDATELGIHLKPTADVRFLRSILRDVSRAGYRKVMLETREAAFPYLPRGYSLTLGKKPINVDVQSDDSIQVLVQALDLAASKTAGNAR